MDTHCRSSWCGERSANLHSISSPDSSAERNYNRPILMILTFEHGLIRELRMNLPPVNALTGELIVALRQAIETAPRQGIRALVLSGTPGRFSGGLDVPLLLTLDRPAIAAVWRELYAL